MNLYSERSTTNDTEKRKRAAAEKQAAIKEAITTGDPQALMLAYDFGIKEFMVATDWNRATLSGERTKILHSNSPI